MRIRCGCANGSSPSDAAPGVDPSSLAIAGARLYWLRGGAPQTALLSP